ncbi:MULTISPECIES: Rrf2 family transcriptional regulator [Clostridium]|jgi:Rrf2 family transcriptional regulator, nitric oxide-sensitive transcriptional repressor|uniref:HTH-type transcriptional regulator NsrR n=2 Tax=root TaxID=1 RepID=R9BVF2_9CLOT|nr:MULTISPECIES: Rrf2 family transcriptional regulator [Clostridium]EOR21124.1 transcriptional regulator, BadM/Rrf2 family protein [Clostridium sartagoforme AAU1]KLE15706.1 Rrf2 family transcriptional regulator [Clostridium sp. C8]
MYLSKFTDYSFRALVYLAENRDKLCTVEELAKKLEISEHHLKKIIHKLAKTDLIISMKGRTGGLKLGLDPQNINLGEVILVTEDNLNIAQCFNKDDCCPFINSGCKLKGIMQNSLSAFLNEFSQYTLQDLLKQENISV